MDPGSFFLDLFLTFSAKTSGMSHLSVPQGRQDRMVPLNNKCN